MWQSIGITTARSARIGGAYSRLRATNAASANTTVSSSTKLAVRLPVSVAQQQQQRSLSVTQTRPEAVAASPKKPKSAKPKTKTDGTGRKRAAKPASPPNPELEREMEIFRLKSMALLRPRIFRLPQNAWSVFLHQEKGQKIAEAGSIASIAKGLSERFRALSSSQLNVSVVPVRF
jgi:hypothetical protein